MDPSASTAPAARLQRLAGYLQQDPGNGALLADACDTAIACGQHEQAESYISTASRLALDDAAWTFRRARLCIARRQLEEAAALLERLQQECGEHPVLAHDLAYVRLLQGDAAASRELLDAWVQDAARLCALDAVERQAMQVLWLRACHRLDALDEASQWVQAQRGAGTLEAAATGVASLIAFDVDDLAATRELADAALAADAGCVEALVARGSLALAQGDSRQAAQWLEAALQRQPDDGRTLSALGFASMLSRDIPKALSQLERAVLGMPDHVETWHALGWARLLQGDREGALDAFRSALALDPESGETHGEIALLLLLTGDAAGAQEHLAQADRLDSGAATARFAHAIASGAAQDPQKLQALLEDLLPQWRPRP